LLFFFKFIPLGFQGLKAKKVKIKAGVTIGPERCRSRKCSAEEQSKNAAATPTDVGTKMMTLVPHQRNC